MITKAGTSPRLGGMFRRGFMSLSILLALASCADSTLSPPSQQVRSLLDGAGIVAVECDSPEPIKKPVSGSGAVAAGAKKGALMPLTAGMQVCSYGRSGDVCALSLGLGLALMPVGAIIGAAVGGTTAAHSEEEIQTTAAALTTRVANAKPAAGIKAEIERMAKSRGSPAFAIRDPSESPQEFAKRLPAVLNIAISNIGFDVSGKIAPDVRLKMTVQVSLKARHDPSWRYWQGWAYRGPIVGYFDIGRNDAAMVEKQLAAAYRALAVAILDHLAYAKEPKVVDLGEDAQVRPLCSSYLDTTIRFSSRVLGAQRGDLAAACMP